MKLPVILLCALLLVPTSTLAKAPTHHATSVKARTFLHVQRSKLEAPQGYSPAQIRQAYGIDRLPDVGAGSTIAIVDAYADPHAASDLATFSQAFSLRPLPNCSLAPSPCLASIQLGSGQSSGWAEETALDIEWAHAIAPAANIVLVQAKSDSLADLTAAVNEAKRHARIISLSWGSKEFSGETGLASSFAQDGYQVVASSGDRGFGASFPAVIPGVISVGGTTLSLDKAGNRLKGEAAWSGSGGGASKYFPLPVYQKSVAARLSSKGRMTPDLAYDADPSTGFAVYDNGEWLTVGGTSAGAPQVAAMLALRTSTALPVAGRLYQAPTSAFSDVVRGRNGACATLCQSHHGYDMTTGLGTPVAGQLIPFLDK